MGQYCSVFANVLLLCLSVKLYIAMYVLIYTKVLDST